MNCYVVTFETKNKESRAKVEEVLKSYDYYCPIHLYCWAIKTEEKATTIRDKVTAVTGANDRVFVLRSGTEAAWINSYGKKNSEWLKENL